MKINSRFALVFAFCVSATAVFAVDDLPKTQSFARYEGMMKKSSFAVATAVVPLRESNFANDLYLANAAKFCDECVVTLASSTDKNLKVYLSTKSPNKNGYRIHRIEWSEGVTPKSQP